MVDDLLRSKGEHVYTLRSRIEELGDGLSAKIQAFVFGIYSRSSFRDMSELIRMESTDIVHVHNLYPQLTLSVLSACRYAGVPVVKHIHDYHLTCPVTSHLRDQKVCVLCCGGREYWCALKNCRKDVFESVAYAIRSGVVRAFRLFTANITLFIVLTRFAKEHLIAQGFRENKIVVLPNPVLLPKFSVDPSLGEYAAFVGRITPEKGIDTLMKSIAQVPQLPIRIAGEGPLLPQIAKNSPNNVTFVGMLNRTELVAFYKKARFVVVPSVLFENCPLVISEAMSHGLPVIASRIGGLPEIVEDEVTGLLFEPKNPEDLANKMRLLWENPSLCRQMGLAGREKAIREYSEDVYYRRLLAVYRKAIKINNERQQGKI
jgi:glycosyltransferase involved in cell wall biosynthesis